MKRERKYNQANPGPKIIDNSTKSQQVSLWQDSSWSLKCQGMRWTTKKENTVSQNSLATDHFLHGTYHGNGLPEKRSHQGSSGVKGGNSIHLHCFSWCFSTLAAYWNHLWSFKKPLPRSYTPEILIYLVCGMAWPSMLSTCPRILMGSHDKNHYYGW